MNFNGVVFENLTIRKSDFTHARFNDCDFRNVIFTNSCFDNVRFEGVVFKDCIIGTTDFVKSFMSTCTFRDTTFAFGSFACSYLEQVAFDNCVFEYGVSFTNVIIERFTTFTRCNLKSICGIKVYELVDACGVSTALILTDQAVLLNNGESSVLLSKEKAKQAQEIMFEFQAGMQVLTESPE